MASCLTIIHIAADQNCGHGLQDHLHYICGGARLPIGGQACLCPHWGLSTPACPLSPSPSPSPLASVCLLPAQHRISSSMRMLLRCFRIQECVKVEVSLFLPSWLLQLCCQAQPNAAISTMLLKMHKSHSTAIDKLQPAIYHCQLWPAHSTSSIFDPKVQANARLHSIYRKQPSTTANKAHEPAALHADRSKNSVYRFLRLQLWYVVHALA